MYYNRRTEQEEFDNAFEKWAVYMLLAFAFPVNILILCGLVCDDKEIREASLELIKPMLRFLLVWFIIVAVYHMLFK